MSVLSYLRGLFGSNDERDGLEILQTLLEERQATLRLSATYQRPSVSTVGETTAVFPIRLTHDGVFYKTVTREFPLPDDGLDDEDSALVQFLANAHGNDPSSVVFEDIPAVEGLEAEATLQENGEVTVSDPNGGL